MTKKKILAKRENYIKRNKDYYGVDFMNEISAIKSILSDMDFEGERGHNIYDLFNDDYRQCNITFEELLEDNPELVSDYLYVKNNSCLNNLNGASGIIYKTIFDKFKREGVFERIGVLQLDAKDSLVSNARLILNYLNYKTHSINSENISPVPFNILANDFEGIINKSELECSLIAMFNLGDASSWNELIAFKEINSEEIKSCESTEVFITKAGHEYLDLIATHFEFFNIRVTKKRSTDFALFSPKSILTHVKIDKYVYNFQEIIENVYEIVKKCCKNMSRFYNEKMYDKYPKIDDYLQSYFVYGDSNVLHGERIIHTHIRYIDHYRLYVLHDSNINIDKKAVNKILVNYIKKYIEIGENNPNILTKMSTEMLFPEFNEKIKLIEENGYEDFNTQINIGSIKST